MNTVWILLWISSSPYMSDGNARQIATEWVDRYSIRPSSASAVKWMNVIKNHGNGFGFRIYESKLWKKETIQ